MVVIGLGKNLLLKYILGHCAMVQPWKSHAKNGKSDSTPWILTLDPCLSGATFRLFLERKTLLQAVLK